MGDEKEDSIKEDCPQIHLEKLVQPAILLLLAKNSAHGYEIIQKLSKLDCLDCDPDTATVYRALRKMEQDGLVFSNWEHGEFGPARRQYSLTAEGRKSLDMWARGLEARIRQIDSFLAQYRDLSSHCITDAARPGAGVKEDGQ